MSRRESVLVAIVFVALALPMMYVKSNQWVEGYADTAMLGQITENIAFKGIPESQTTPSLYELFVVRYIPSLPADQACNASLASPMEATVNYFRYHLYWILYLIAPLVWILPVSIVLPSLTVLSFLGLIFLTYHYLRLSGVPIVGSLIFCLLVSFHPMWSQSLAFGQVYADRFFLLLGMMFIYAFVKPSPNKVIVLLLGLLSALVVERVGLIVGTFMIAYVVLFWRECKSVRYFSLGFGAILFVLSFLAIQLCIADNVYGSYLPTSLTGLIARLSRPVFAENLMIFLLFNLGMLGVFALFNPKGLILALGVMLPNMIGDIGGAEKTGWSIHYHSLYFPVLVWAAAGGYSWLFTRLHSLRLRVLICIAATCLMVFFGGMNPFARQPVRSFSLTNLLPNNAISQMLLRLPDYWNDKRRQELHAVYDEIRRVIPEGSVASVPEGLFPALYERRTVYIYPIGLESADYAVPIAVSYRGEEDRIRLEQCLRGRMRSLGYDMDNPIHAGNAQVFKRIPPP